METKQKVDITTAVLLILIGVIWLICPNIKYTNINTLWLGTLLTYSLINLTKFLLTKECHDYEGILSFFASLLIAIISYFYKISSNTMHLVILFLIWIALFSLIKLKKADYYNDRKSKLWILEISLLFIFILTGILISVNLNYPSEIQILILGCFFLIHGILEFMDPVIIYLTKERIRK